jgi:hypothetical protein
MSDGLSQPGDMIGPQINVAVGYPTGVENDRQFSAQPRP